MNTDMRSERIERNAMMIARGQTRARLDSEKAEKARLREACIRWLETEGNAGKLSAVIAQRQDGTCRWLFEHYTYKRWIAASNGFLWLAGIPGSGKTVLASAVTQAIMEDQHPAVVYHFCDFRNTSSISVTSVLHSILSQFLRSGPVEWLNAGGIASKDEISEAMTSDSKANELILIPHLLHLSRTCNVFASSRDEHSIRVLLKDELTICLHGETDLVNGDIRAHTLHELRNKPRLSRLPRQEILDALLPKANCMFRWVQCQLYLLEKCKTLLAMKTVLSNLPKTLYETYERILRSISGENAELGEERIVRYTLRWLVGASRPLRLNELNDAIAIEVGCSTLSDDLRVIDATDILTSCGSLVRFDKGEGDGEYVVGLSHFTVQEYLLTAALARDSNLGLYAMTLPDMHRDLALLCLAYVLLDAFRDGPCVDKSSLDRRIQTFPMYPYTTRHWAEHVRQIPEYDDEVYTTIKRLLGDEETEPQRLAMCQRDLWPHSHWETYDVPAQPWLVVLAQRTWLARHIVSEFPEWVTIGITQRADVPRIPFDAVFSDNEWAERYMRDIITPLTAAACLGLLDLTSVILDAGADIDALDPNDPHPRTAVNLAVAYDKIEAAKMLLECGADVEKPVGHRAETVMHVAALQGKMDMVHLLVRHGVDRDARNGDGATALHSAIEGNNADIVAALLEAGYDANAVSHSGKHVLQKALDIRSPTIVQHLLNHGAQALQLNYSPSGLEWASNQSWHSALSAGLMRRQPLSDTDLQDVHDILLRLRLPDTIASDILDFAEFWRCSSVARSEYVMMPMGSTKEKPYLLIKVPDRPLHALTIITDSHDQGWSSYPEEHGTYRGCFSWFDAHIPDSGVRQHIQANVHASGERRRHVNTWDCRPPDTKWTRHLSAGNELQLVAIAWCPGWENHVYQGEIRIFSRF
ncbi:hypothetical protein K525DRAFT_264872 [Schizophyllum commune Loenen D]|nr:hypothetical protein K525DRAFT_264872 [Schizophyllum commune Loenen D]